MNANTNNTGTNNTSAKTTSSRKRYSTVLVFGEPITKNVLVRVPAEANSFMRLIPAHELENGRRVNEHYKCGAKVYSADKKTSVVMNKHFYGFESKHLGKSMVANVKIVRMTRADGKTFVHLDIYRQKAGTQAERILTITNEDKGILINGTDARILFIKAQPRPVKAEASAEAGTATKPETLASETAASTPVTPVAETKTETRVDAPHADSYEGKKAKREKRERAPKPKQKKSRLAKYEFKEVEKTPGAEKPRRKKSEGKRLDTKGHILSTARENGWDAKVQGDKVKITIADGITVTREAIE